MSVIAALLVLLVLSGLAFTFLPLGMAAIIAAVLATIGVWIVAAEIDNRKDRRQ